MLSGRKSELGRCADVLDRATVASGRLELLGEPGIGKSALFEEVVDNALARGFRVLRAVPSHAESALAFAGLSDLLSDVTDLTSLLAPQQRALDVALGRTIGDGTPTSTRTLGAGVSAVLQMLADEGPTLIAIDDSQWLDAATADVLAFATRRLPERNVVVLLSHRDDVAATFDTTEQLVVGPLPDDAVRTLVHQAAATHVPGAALDRIIETAGGSPLYAIELTRSMSPAASPRPIVPLPVPASLSQLVADRVTALPPQTIEALAAVALLAAPSIDALSQLEMLDDLAPAERAGVVAIVGRDIRFAHPMLASAAHDAVPGTHRLRLHRRLAEVTGGLERCVHLALGTDRRDAAVAGELADALPKLMTSGASAEAADLAVLALSITPLDDPARHERMLVCSDALFRAGRTQEAIEHLERARNEATSDHLLARALLGLATIEYSHTDNADEACRLALQALELTDDPALLADAHTTLSRVIWTDFIAAADHAAEALRLMESTNTTDGLSLAMALNASASANFMAGRGLDRSMFARAIELERGSAISAADSAAGALAALLKYADELDEARAMFESLVDEADEGSLPYVLGHLPQLELWTGRWDEAERIANRHLELARRTQQDSQVQGALFNVALVAAYRGTIEAAKPIAQALFDDGVSSGSTWTERNGAALLGFLAMSVGDAAAGARFLGRYDEIGEAMGLFEPGYTRFHGDYVEALVATGAIDKATEVLDRIEPRAIHHNRPSAIGAARRGRALVSAHVGDVEVAVESARAAIAAYAGTSFVYERARAHLVLGTILRRFKFKAEARVAFNDALQMFETIGARSLVERTRLELSRLGGRVATAPFALSETESRVAQLAASGRTSRQIADTMFVSIKTVEANMTRIYRKLGVANRAELANLLAGDQRPDRA